MYTPSIINISEWRRRSCPTFFSQFISEDHIQDTKFVYQTQTMIICCLKETVPKIENIVYFSDGYEAQYKSYKNLMHP